MLGMMTFMPSISFANDYRDSIVMNRVWTYHQNLMQDVSDFTPNSYLVFTMNVKRRNALMWLIPTLYSIAKGDRQYVGEIYGKLLAGNQGHFDPVFQVKSGTVPHLRRPIPDLFNNLSPNIYGELLYGDRLLSPFHRSNRHYYKYRIYYGTDSIALISFTPRVDNTQLVAGEAEVYMRTGSIKLLRFKGEYDMLKFRVTTTMNPDSPYELPVTSNTEAKFKFMGNAINADFTTVNYCPQTLPDSIRDRASIRLMEKVRPFPLTHFQDSIYKNHYAEQLLLQEMLTGDTMSNTRKQAEKVKHFVWDVLGDHMVNSTGFRSGNTTMRISPLLNPLYMSYSTRKGLSYKLRGSLYYNRNNKPFLALEPRLGYTFKLRQFYYTLPLTITYDSDHDGMTGIIWGNGNRTSNGALAESFRNRIGGDSIALPEFRDEYVTIYNHIGILNWVSLTTGLNYHLRKALGERELMHQAGLPVVYRSFAPFLTIHLTPWKKGPVLTTNYERSIMKVLGANLQYERWEFDASYKRSIKSMRILNLRAGAGFYTHRSTDYFVDFTNFHDNNLPTGWDDDWSGQFQLVDSRWYNESNYYIRGHVSYDSPLLALSWLPWVGRFIETECLYFSALSIERARGYFELGYGLKNRYFSTAIFASFLNTNYNAIEAKFTFELFRRW